METIAFTLAYIVPASFAAIGCSWIGASAMKAAGRNPEKINDLRTMMIIDALAIIGFVAAIVGKVM